MQNSQIEIGPNLPLKLVRKNPKISGYKKRETKAKVTHNKARLFPVKGQATPGVN